MKFLKTFSQPIIFALVWLLNIRPGSLIIDKYFTNLQLGDTTKSALDIALLASLVSFLISLWKQPLSISTKLLNCDTGREHSTFSDKSVLTTQRIYLEVKLKMKNWKYVNWNKAIQLFGGFYVTFKDNSFMSYQFDSQISSALIVEQQKIHLFQKGFDISESLELLYYVQFRRTAQETRTIDIVTSIEPVCKNWFLKQLCHFIFLILIKDENGKHKSYFDDKRLSD